MSSNGTNCSYPSTSCRTGADNVPGSVARATDLRERLELVLASRSQSCRDSLAHLMGLAEPPMPVIVLDDSRRPALLADALVRDGWVRVGTGRPLEGSEDGIDNDRELVVYLAEGDIDVLDLLGIYQPDHYRVTLFLRLIDLVAARLHLDPEALAEVVLVHELAHAVTHRGLDLDCREWDAFRVAPPSDVELFAQLYAAKHLEVNGPLAALAAMKTLAEGQPRIYQTYREVVGEPLEAQREGLLSARRRTTAEIAATWGAAQIAERARRSRSRAMQMAARGETGIRLEIDPDLAGPRATAIGGSPLSGRLSIDADIHGVSPTEIVIRDQGGRFSAIPWEAIVFCDSAAHGEG